MCGGGEIRTHGTISSTAVFKTAALNRSATPPTYIDNRTKGRSVHRKRFLFADFVFAEAKRNLFLWTGGESDP